MALKLMFITNKPQMAKVAEESGVDWIFIDLEINGKEKRQENLDTVISKHNVEDIPLIKNVLTKSKVLVRINPIHDKSESEINTVIANGADIIMLPYFKTKEEVQIFTEIVNKRIKTCLLIETAEAVENLDSLLGVGCIDYAHIGLNDLHLSYNNKFMFEPLANGIVENIIEKLKKYNITFGFGGIAKLGSGMLPAESILMEHYRLGSNMVILSRSFHDSRDEEFDEDTKYLFKENVHKIRDFEMLLKSKKAKDYNDNKLRVKEIVNQIIN